MDPQRAGARALTGSRRLTQPEWAQVRAAFEALAEVPPAEREARLGRLGLAPDLTLRLRAMLIAQDAPGVLDGSAPVERQGPVPTYASLEAGTVVGGFRVDRLIGRGGMGEVYQAHRDGADFKQEVALKLLRPEAVERFAAFATERRLLAGLEHPCIARLIDGGIAPDGRPYMAMEYVAGEPIDRWCAARHVDVAARLALFLQVCDAVSHAHARLVIHRDLKPDNILVDTDGRARLLDFGVARLIDPTGDERAVTDALLTPQFAAPEQLAGGAMTVATDVYALGAVLYDLLAGHGPWQAREQEAGLPTVFRRLLRDDPPPPSAGANDPDVPARALSGDLDAIVLKAMRHAPADRYASVDALAADVRRHLEHRPVAARAGAAGYRLRRFLRRNRWGVAAATALTLAILVGLAGTAWQAHRAAEQRDLARSEAERTEAVNQAMMLMFREASDEGRAGSITARELIDSTAKRLVSSLDPAAPQSAAVIAALSDLYILTEDLPASKALLEEALTRHIGHGDAAGTARMQLRLAQAYGASKRFAEARALLARATPVFAADPVRFAVDRVEAASAEAYMLRLEGKPDEGIALLEATMPDAERAYGQNSRDLATRYANLATHLVMANRLDQAAATIGKAEAVMARAGMTPSPAALTLVQLKGGIASRRGDPATAERLFHQVAETRRALYGRSYSLAVDLLQEGRMLNQLGRGAEGLRVLDEAQPMATEYLGAQSQPALLAGLGRAESLTLLGRRDAARQALAAVEHGLGAGGTGTVEYGALSLARANLALADGNVDGARSAWGEAHAAFAAAGSAGVTYQRALGQVAAKLARQGATHAR